MIRYCNLCVERRTRKRKKIERELVTKIGLFFVNYSTLRSRFIGSFEWFISVKFHAFFDKIQIHSLTRFLFFVQ